MIKPDVQEFTLMACLKLYLWHGFRQYTPRTVSYITQLFDASNSYPILVNLGDTCSDKFYKGEI